MRRTRAVLDWYWVEGRWSRPMLLLWNRVRADQYADALMEERHA